MTDHDFNYYMSKDKVDDEYITWLANEFNLNRETIISVAEINGSDPYQTYHDLEREVNTKGYGFDQEQVDWEDDDTPSEYFAIDIDLNDMKNIFNPKAIIGEPNAIMSFNTLSKIIDKNPMLSVDLYRDELSTFSDNLKQAQEDVLEMIAYMIKQYPHALNIDYFKQVFNPKKLVKKTHNYQDVAEGKSKKKVGLKDRRKIVNEFESIFNKVNNIISNEKKSKIKQK